MVGCRHPQSCHRQRGRLKPTWAPKGAIQCRYRRNRDVSRADAPPRHDGPLLTGGGLAQTKRRGGCRADSCGHAATGEPPGIDEASEPRRVALQAGPGALTSSGRADKPQRWQARRAETVLAATVGHRQAAAAALDGKRKGVKGTLAALAAAPPVSRSEAADRPSALSYPTPAPGPRCGPGARSIASRPREPAARTRLWRDRSPDVHGPVVHQYPAPVEQVAAPVRGLDPIAVDVRKRELADLARRVGALRRPIPKA